MQYELRSLTLFDVGEIADSIRWFFPDQPMDLAAFVQEEFCEEVAVLSSDAGYQYFSTHFLFSEANQMERCQWPRKRQGMGVIKRMCSPIQISNSQILALEGTIHKYR